ncbi:hypothetical protein Vadar_027591 [Vaccinium darrowii]|uniref:Uncharacterized protein n=1 Tax=Vaccinium darrowii TaxID=229202 RepID=A0ACB7XCP8_9ERIC|nr:hypothetical protein Vadar_027591 [Vaccinium darrowii]
MLLLDRCLNDVAAVDARMVHMLLMLDCPGEKRQEEIEMQALRSVPFIAEATVLEGQSGAVGTIPEGQSDDCIAFRHCRNGASLSKRTSPGDDEYNNVQSDSDLGYSNRGFGENGYCGKFMHGGFGESPESKVNGFDEYLRMKAIQQQRFAVSSQLMGGGPFLYTNA